MGRIMKNFIFNSCSQLLSIIIPLITAPYLSRVLGPSNIGIESYINAMSQIFYTFGMIGLTNYSTREIAYVRDSKHERSKVFWEMMIDRVIVFGITLVIFLIVGHFNKYSSFFVIQIVWLFAMFFDVSWFFIGMEMFGLTVLRNFIVRMLTIICIFAFIKDADDFVLYIILCALSQLIGTLSIFPQLRPYIERVEVKELNLTKHFIPSIRVFLPQFASTLYLQVDKVMIEAICIDTKQIAYYGQAEKLIKAPIALITAVSSVMMPRIANEFSKNNLEKIKGYLEVTLKGLMLMAWPVAFGMAAIADKMIPWYLGPAFEPAIIAMIILAPIIVAIAASSLSANQYFLATNQTKIMTISYSVSACLNLLINALFIPKYGFIGAAMGTIAAEYTVFIMQYYVMNKQIRIIPVMFRSLKYGFLSAIMFVIVWFVGKDSSASVYTTLIQTGVGVAVYVLLLCVTRDDLFFTILKNIVYRRAKR